eukprot:scaffold27445_cov129-Isochrysis_galbana.AAC.1
MRCELFNIGGLKKPCVVFSRGAPTNGWHRSPTLTAADGGSMPGPAKHPSLRHPTTIRYVQPRPPSARREPHPTLNLRKALET